MFRVLLILSVFAVGSLGAATIYVPDDWPTIQGAIDASANGDEIIVRPGTYKGTISFFGKAVHLKSEYGPKQTIIDGNQEAGVLLWTGEQRDSILDGFTITNCFGSHGSAILCNNSPTIKNNIITGNTASCCGGGIKTWSDMGESALIVNNLIYDNHVDHAGGGIRCQGDSAPIILNNTIFGNSAGNQGGGIEHRKDSAAVAVNNILWNNTAPAGAEIYDTSSITISVTYSDVENGWPGVGNIDAVPLFAEPSQNDFHLTLDSPCRDSGDNSPGLVDEDFEGDPRVAFGNVDIGADEFWHHLYHVGNVIPGNTLSVRVVGWPNGCTKLLMGSGIKTPPQPTTWGDFYLESPVSLFYLGIVPTNGILVKNMSIPLNWSQGELYPFQAFIGSPQWPSSKLTNLMVVVVE